MQSKTKLAIMFLLFCLSFSQLCHSMHAKNSLGFVSDWTIHHQKALRNSPQGTYAIFELANEPGTFVFAVNNQGKLQGKEFRHDKKLVVRPIYASAFTITTPYVEHIDDLTVNGEGKEIFLKNNTIALCGPISEEALKLADNAAEMDQNMKENLLKQDWRSAAIKYLSYHMDDDKYKYEIKEEIRPVLYHLKNSPEYKESAYIFFKSQLESTPFSSHTLGI